MHKQETKLQTSCDKIYSLERHLINQSRLQRRKIFSLFYLWTKINDQVLHRFHSYE
jgi:hypothetical protein